MTTDTTAATQATTKLIRADIALDAAVRREATFIMKQPIDTIDRAKVDDHLRKAWKKYASTDTFIAFVDKVYDRLEKSYHAKDKHVGWLKANFGLSD